MEAKRIAEEQMQPIGENEQFEWDGLRRRKTILDPNHPTRSATVIRHNVKPVHPPLGMSQFPSAEDSDDDTTYHPGFFQRLRSRGKSSASTRPPTQGTSVGLESFPPMPTDGAADERSDTKSYHKDMQMDTSYRPLESTIHFAPEPSYSQQRQGSRGSTHTPKPASHIAKRQFSFQNPFHRNRSQSMGEGAESKRPTSRHSRKNSRDHKTTTEEERLGLVKGDSSNLLSVIPSRSSRDVTPPYADRDDGWGEQRLQNPSGPQETSAQGKSGVRRVDTEGTLHEEYEKDLEKRRDPSSGGGAFL